MQVSCPKCSTKFFIEEEKIGKAGKKVKCSACGKIWHQQIVNQDTTNSKKLQIVKEKQENKNTNFIMKESPASNINLPSTNKIAHLPVVVPVRQEQNNYYFMIITLGLIMMLLVVLLPNSSYEKYLIRYKNLEIEDIVTNYQTTSQTFSIKYKVINNSEYSVRLPLIKTKLLKKNGSVVTASIDDPGTVILAPYESINVRTEFKPIMNSIYSVDIAIGRCFEN